MKVSVIGIGNVGSALVQGLNSAGVEVISIIGKDEKVLSRISKRINCKYSLDVESVVGDSSDVIAICVKDGQLKTVADLLSPYKNKLRGRILFHTSGSISSDILHIVSTKTNCGSFHPVQTFNRLSFKNNTLFEGISIGIEGGKNAIEVLQIISSKLKAETLFVPSNKKPLYHIASVIASNFLVCYIDIIRDIMNDVTGKESDVYKIYSPIILNTLSNIKNYGVDESLTGPIKRQDLKTLMAHFDAISDDKELKTFYTTLSKKALGITNRKGEMSKETFDKFVKLLSNKK